MNTQPIFAEKLPGNCPPADANSPNEMVVFRLVEGTVPTERDFEPYAIRSPDKYGKKCKAYAVSVFNNTDALNRLLQMPVHARKKVGRIVLSQHSGLIKQTGDDKCHYSWWRYDSFNAVSACEVLP